MRHAGTPPAETIAVAELVQKAQLAKAVARIAADRERASLAVNPAAIDRTDHRAILDNLSGIAAGRVLVRRLADAESNVEAVQ